MKTAPFAREGIFKLFVKRHMVPSYSATLYSFIHGDSLAPNVYFVYDSSQGGEFYVSFFSHFSGICSRAKLFLMLLKIIIRVTTSYITCFRFDRLVSCVTARKFKIAQFLTNLTSLTQTRTF